ncbi:MAG: OB-fold domain-containing protein [Candidatus Gottesmanbacteria bacterium]|nr:OB-fold domain-containing protein [Candidatus Gottesmanbacteria bacterium]
MNSPVKIWRNQKYIAKMLGREGTIVSWTVVRVPPAGFSNLAPYPVVVVDILGGTRIMAQLVEWQEENLTVGQRVKVVVRRICEPTTEGVIPYGIKVKPIDI